MWHMQQGHMCVICIFVETESYYWVRCQTHFEHAQLSTHSVSERIDFWKTPSKNSPSWSFLPLAKGQIRNANPMAHKQLMLLVQVFTRLSWAVHSFCIWKPIGITRSTSKGSCSLTLHCGSLMSNDITWSIVNSACWTPKNKKNQPCMHAPSKREKLT